VCASLSLSIPVQELYALVTQMRQRLGGCRGRAMPHSTVKHRECQMSTVRDSADSTEGSVGVPCPCHLSPQLSTSVVVSRASVGTGREWGNSRRDMGTWGMAMGTCTSTCLPGSARRRSGVSAALDAAQ